MTLAQRFSRLTANHVHAIEVPCTLLAAQRFRKGDWVSLAGGREIWRVWGHRNDADVLLLY